MPPYDVTSRNITGNVCAGWNCTYCPEGQRHVGDYYRFCKMMLLFCLYCFYTVLFILFCFGACWVLLLASPRPMVLGQGWGAFLNKLLSSERRWATHAKQCKPCKQCKQSSEGAMQQATRGVCATGAAGWCKGVIGGLCCTENPKLNKLAPEHHITTYCTMEHSARYC